jgi:hypothetical protein
MLVFLLQNCADPHITSLCGTNDEENVLSVATRWGHVNVVEYLITSVKWKTCEIVAAKKHATGTRMMSVYKRNGKSGRKGCRCFGL